MAAASPDPKAIGAAVRGHRVYYEVYAERAVGVSGRAVVAVEVRLWSTLEKAGAKVLTARAAAEAATLVGAAALGEDAAGDLEPFHSALYDSRQVPGADEVYVAIALRLRGDGGEAERDRDRRLQALRRRLEALGVYAGRWHEPPQRTAEPAEPWHVQAAAGATATAA